MADQTLSFRLAIDGKEAVAVLDETKGKFVETGEVAEKFNEQIKTGFEDLTGKFLKLNQATEGTGINNLQNSLSGLSGEINDATAFLDNFNRGNKAVSENLPETVRLINLTEKEVGEFDSKIKVTQAGWGIGIAEAVSIASDLLSIILAITSLSEKELEKHKERVKQLRENFSKFYREQLEENIAKHEKLIKELEEKRPALKNAKGEYGTVDKSGISGLATAYGPELKKDLEIYQQLQTELKLAKEALKDLGDIENVNNKITANLERMGDVSTKNLDLYKDVIKIIKEQNEGLKDTEITPQMVRNKLAEWIISLLKERAQMFGPLAGYTEGGSSSGVQKENLFDKRKGELLEAQRHAELLLKLDSANDDLMLSLKIKHFDAMITLYKKFGQDTTELLKQRVEAEVELLSNIAPRGVEKGEKKKMEMYRITEKFHVDHQKKLQKAAELTTKDKLNLLYEERDAVADSLGQISGMFAQHTLAYQAFAKAQALIDTYTAAEAAYKAVAGIPIVGPALAVAAAIAATVAGLARVEQIGKVEIPKGFEQGGRLPKGKAGIFEGTANEIVAPESDFKTYSAELVRQALIESRNYISVSSGAGSSNELKAIKDELTGLKPAIERMVNEGVAAYFDDRQAKKVYRSGSRQNRRGKI